MRRSGLFVLPSLALGTCLGLLAPFTLGAQQRAPRCTAPEHRQFDYWIGDWEVTDSAGVVPYGTNNVTLEEDGCVIHEHWAGSRGGTGQSFNVWEPQRRVWQQLWVSSSPGTLLLTGKLEGNTIVLGADQPNPNGTGTTKQEIRWIPQADGRVRQLWRSSTDGGQTWTVAFDGYYRKKRT